MDPMIDFVRERTTDLQRTAATVRRDRDLRQAPVAATVPSTAAVIPAAAPAMSAVAPASNQPDDPCQGVACAPSGVRHAA
jgi:hypothetical protein